MDLELHLPPADADGSRRAIAECPSILNVDEGLQKITLQRKGVLGKGGFATVFEAEDQSNGTTCALKVVSKAHLRKPLDLQKLQTEIAIHGQLRHRNIVRFLGHFSDTENVYLMLEHCSGITVRDIVQQQGRLTEEQAVEVIVQIMPAVLYLHNRLIVHRDLKLSNLLLDDKQRVKLSDFGLAAKLQGPSERRRTLCGTPNYIAPEVLAEGSGGHGQEVDIWAIGVILYTMLVGHSPFETANVKATYQKIQAVDYTFPSEAMISDDAKDLIASILRRDPSQRPTLSAIYRHPFLQRHAQLRHTQRASSGKDGLDISSISISACSDNGTPSNEQYEPWVPVAALQGHVQQHCSDDFLNRSIIGSGLRPPDDTLEQLASSIVEETETQSPRGPRNSTPERLIADQLPDGALNCSNSSSSSTASRPEVVLTSQGVEAAASVSPLPPNPFLDLQLDQLGEEKEEEQQQQQQQCEGASLQQQQQEGLSQQLQQVQPASRRPFNLQVVLPEHTGCIVTDDPGPDQQQLPEDLDQQQLQTSWSFDLGLNLQRTVSVPALASPSCFGSSSDSSITKNSALFCDQGHLQSSNSVPSEISFALGQGTRCSRASAARLRPPGVSVPCPPGQPKLGSAAQSPRAKHPGPVHMGGPGSTVAGNGAAVSGTAIANQQQQRAGCAADPMPAVGFLGGVASGSSMGWFQRDRAGLGRMDREQMGEAAGCQQGQVQVPEIKQHHGLTVSKQGRGHVVRDITLSLHEAAAAEESGTNGGELTNCVVTTDVRASVDQDAARDMAGWPHKNLHWGPESRGKQAGKEDDMKVHRSSGTGLSFRHLASSQRCGKCAVWAEPCRACADSSAGNSMMLRCSSVNMLDFATQDLPPRPPTAHSRSSAHGQQQQQQPRGRSMDEEENYAASGREHGSLAGMGTLGNHPAASPRAVLRPLHPFEMDQQQLPRLSSGDWTVEAGQHHQQYVHQQFQPHPPHVSRACSRSPAPPPVPPSPQQRQAAHARQRSANSLSSPCASPVTHSVQQHLLSHHQQQQQSLQGDLSRQELGFGLLARASSSPASMKPAPLQVPETPKQQWLLDGGEEAPNSGSSGTSTAPCYDPAAFAAIYSHLRPRAASNQQQQVRQHSSQHGSARSSGIGDGAAATDISPASSSWSWCSGLSVTGPLGPGACFSGALRARTGSGEMLPTASPRRSSQLCSRLSGQQPQLEQTRSGSSSSIGAWPATGPGSSSSIGAWPATPGPTSYSGISTPAGTPRTTHLPLLTIAEPLPPKADRPIGRSPAAVKRNLTPVSGLHSPKLAVIGSPNFKYLQQHQQQQQTNPSTSTGLGSPGTNILASLPVCSTNGVGVGSANISSTSTAASSGRGSGAGGRQIPLFGGLPLPAFVGLYGLPAVHEHLPLSPNQLVDGDDDSVSAIPLPTLGHSPGPKIAVPSQQGLGQAGASSVSNAASMGGMLPVGGTSIMAGLLASQCGEEMLLSVGSRRPRSPLGAASVPMVEFGCSVPQLGLLEPQQQTPSNAMGQWLPHLGRCDQLQQQEPAVPLPSALLSRALSSSSSLSPRQVDVPVTGGLGQPAGHHPTNGPRSPLQRRSALPVHCTSAACDPAPAAHALADQTCPSHGAAMVPSFARAQSRAAASVMGDTPAGRSTASMPVESSGRVQLGMPEVGKAAATYRVPGMVQQQDEQQQQRHQQEQGQAVEKMQDKLGRQASMVAEGEGAACGRSNSLHKLDGLTPVVDAPGAAKSIGAFGAYVVRYINHPEGFGYLMSNGMLGVVYEDDSRMLALPSLGNMCYLPSKESSDLAAQTAAAVPLRCASVELIEGCFSRSKSKSCLQRSSSTVPAAPAFSASGNTSTGLSGVVCSITEPAGGPTELLDMEKTALSIPFSWEQQGSKPGSSSSSSSSSSCYSGLPKELQEKVAFMQRCIRCLLRQEQDRELDPLLVDVASCDVCTGPDTATQCTLASGPDAAAGVTSSLKGLHGDVVHVQSWAQIPKCLVLRLSLARVQAVFRDGGLLLIHQRKNFAAYRAPPAGEGPAAGNVQAAGSAAPAIEGFVLLPLDMATGCPEMEKRLRHVKALQLNL